MGLKNRIRNYFSLNEDEKDEVLVDIIRIYKQELETTPYFNIKALIDLDIQRYTVEEEFELVQALTDIKNEINKLEEQIKKENGL